MMHGLEWLPDGVNEHLIFQIIGHLSYALSACAFLLRDMLALRLFAIGASLANITFSYFAPEVPNPIPIMWQSLFATINTVWSIRLIRERAGVHFSEEEKELFQTMFRSFSPVEFMKLMRIAQWRDATPGHQFCAAGEPIADVMLIYNGEARVQLPRGGHRSLKDGAFVGEMSFIRGGGASATVTAEQQTRYIAWPKEALQALLQRNPAMRSTMQTVFSEDLTKKLMEP